MSQNSIEDYFQEVTNIVASQESVIKEKISQKKYSLYTWRIS